MLGNLILFSHFQYQFGKVEEMVFVILLIFSFLLFPSEGQITSPPDGSNQTVLPGSTVTIIWSFEDKLSGVSYRLWRFTSSDGSFQNERLARFIDDGDPEYFNIGLSGVSIAKPATLVLKNVNQTYDGTYQFTISGRSSAVVVFIARKPTVTINCSNPFTVKEDHDLICLCKGENGNPPGDVIWYDKNDDPIGQKEKEQKALVLRSVTEADGGTYTCKAQSYTLMDEKSIEVNVALNFKPNETDIEFSRNPAIIGEEITITCSSKGQPKPLFTIIHNGTVNITGIEETYTKQDVQWNDAGYYTCVAMNKLGSDQSDSKFLNVTVQATMTTIPFTSTEVSETEKSSSVDTSSGTEWYIIVIALVSGFIAGILFSYIIQCSHRRWFKKKKPKQNPDEQPTEADSTYQELDLSKMNQEDNYQSLKGNAARINDVTNDDESTYTELSKTRDVEDNYQSLT